MSNLVVLIISPLASASGNKSTALRIRSYFDRCFLKDIKDFKNEFDLKDFILKNDVSCVISIHAYRSGQLFQNGCIVPYAFIFAGTDLNVFSKNEKHRDFMHDAIYNAKFTVTFNRYMEGLISKTWPEFKKKKNFVIPQAISASILHEPIEIGYPYFSNCNVFLLVAGLRSEKDPLYLLEAFQNWHDTQRNDVFLVVVGAQIDQSYTTMFLNIIKKFNSVVYIGQLDQQDMWTMMVRSVAVVNSSVTEGMCNTILEAMSLGVPVLARMNSSNEYVMEDGYNGYTYNTPTEFVSKADALLSADSSSRRQIIENAKQHIYHHHNPEKERMCYVGLVRRLSGGDQFDGYTIDGDDDITNNIVDNNDDDESNNDDNVSIVNDAADNVDDAISTVH